MAVAEKIEPGPGLRAASLLVVLLLAKGLTLVGRQVPVSCWSPLVYTWQDLLVAAMFWGLDRTVRFRGFGWASYATVLAYVAFNVPLVRILSSPLTPAMMRAARGTLADSIRHCLTAANVAWMAAVIVAAVLVPLALRGVRFRPGWRASAVCVGLGVLGNWGTSRIDTMGLHRNAFVAVAAGLVPRVTARLSDTEWRRSPFEQGHAEDLSKFRGQAAGRNVVMIHLESTGARYLGLYGAAEDPMPGLTALARNSVVFENVYAVYPESIKGLLSVLCSRYPALDTQPETCARLRTPALAQVLVKAGYATALFHSGRFDYLGMQAVIDNRGYKVLEDAGDIGGNHQSSFGVEEAATVRRMLAWIDSLPRNRPFLINYVPIAGHHPYESPAPGPFPERDDLNRYRNALHYEDATLAAFLGGLKARGLFDKTLLVIFGDHGEAFGQHDGNYAHTLFIYDENLRVPLLLVAPGLFHGETRIVRIASLLDLAPTILELLRLPVPRGYQGSSLLDAAWRMALFYADYSMGWLGLRDGRWKFVHELESNRSRLYDLERDPGETQDRAAEFPGRIAAYRDRVERWSAAQRAWVLDGGGPNVCAHR